MGVHGFMDGFRLAELVQLRIDVGLLCGHLNGSLGIVLTPSCDL